MVMRPAVRLLREEGGATTMEVVIVINTILLILVAFIEFGVAVQQWNQAAKAVQVGARLAAVSDPLDSTLAAWTGVTDTAKQGDPISAGFDVTCTSDGCAPGGVLDTAALDRLVAGSATRVGMAGVMPRIGVDNVQVRYRFTGLGYVGRTAGPVPSITVSLRNVSFDLLILGRLLGLDQLAMPSFAVTVVGEDLSSTIAN